MEGKYVPFFLIRARTPEEAIEADLRRYFAHQGGEYAPVETTQRRSVVGSSGMGESDDSAPTVRADLAGLNLSLVYQVERNRGGYALLRYQFWIVVVFLLTLFLVAIFAVVIRNLVVQPVTFEDVSVQFARLSSLLSTLYRFETDVLAYEPPVGNLTATTESEADTDLRDSSLRIGEVAGRTGFRTVSYFISVLKRNTGMTPQQYRTESG